MNQTSDDECQKCREYFGVPPSGVLGFQKTLTHTRIVDRPVYCDCPTGVQLQKERKLNKLLGGKA